MRKEARREQVLKRKNFLPTLLVTIILWALLGGIIYFIDPDTFLIIPTFFLLSFFALLFTFSLIFAGSRRGLLISLSLSLFLILTYLGIGNIINLILILAIAICVEVYFGQR